MSHNCSIYVENNAICVKFVANLIWNQTFKNFMFINIK